MSVFFFFAKLENVREEKNEKARVKNFHLFYIIDFAGHSKTFQPSISSVAIRTFTFPEFPMSRKKNEISYFSLLFIFHPFSERNSSEFPCTHIHIYLILKIQCGGGKTSV